MSEYILCYQQKQEFMTLREMKYVGQASHTWILQVISNLRIHFLEN